MKEILQVNGMTCVHCENKIKTFVGEVQGVSEIQVDLTNKQIAVSFEPPATLEQIKEAILDSGFEIT